jgi:polyphosphate glucokinase
MTDSTTRPARAPRATAARSAGAAGTRSAAPARSRSATSKRPAGPVTLAFDIGGTGFKASVLDAAGKMLADRVRVATRYPCPPASMFDRISAGFPGVVREGTVRTAPHFVTKKGPGSAVDPRLLEAWTGFDLAGALTEQFHKPARVANDADLQGLEVVSGSGLEMVVTLGTGVGTALFWHGRLAPHLELAHHPFRKGQTYNEQLGAATLERIGASKWRRRVREAIVNFRVLVNFDRLYLGGGNSGIMAGHVGDDVVIVDNVAGILGGIKLWEDGAPAT